MAETGFSHRLTVYKIVGYFFAPSYFKKSGNNQVKNSFFRISNILVPFPHAQLRGRTAIKKLWTFFGPWGQHRSQLPQCCILRVKQIHLSTASKGTTRLHIYVSQQTRANVRTMLDQRRKRWANNVPALAECLCLLGSHQALIQIPESV